jgi:hypothetical protein
MWTQYARASTCPVTVCREYPEHGALDCRQKDDGLAPSVLLDAGLWGCLQREGAC